MMDSLTLTLRDHLNAKSCDNDLSLHANILKPAELLKGCAIGI